MHSLTFADERLHRVCARSHNLFQLSNFCNHSYCVLPTNSLYKNHLLLIVGAASKQLQATSKHSVQWSKEMVENPAVIIKTSETQREFPLSDGEIVLTYKVSMSLYLNWRLEMLTILLASL